MSTTVADRDQMIDALVGLFRTITTALIAKNRERALELIESMRIACDELTGDVNKQRRG